MTCLPYMGKKQMASFLGMSRPTLDRYLDGMWKFIPSRYPRYAIAGRRFSLFAVIDYMTYKDWLDDEKLRKQCPEFNPIAIARMCGQEGVTT